MGLHHGDVQPGNIFVLANKRLKLIDTCFLNDSENAFERRLRDFEYPCTISPQAIEGLKFNVHKGGYDKEKNDVWGLGITLLSTLINEDHTRYYDWSRYEINFTVIEDRLIRLEQEGYSQDILALIRSMLDSDDRRRPSFAALAACVVSSQPIPLEKINVNQFSVRESIADFQLIKQRTFYGDIRGESQQYPTTQQIAPHNAFQPANSYSSFPEPDLKENSNGGANLPNGAMNQRRSFSEKNNVNWVGYENFNTPNQPQQEQAQEQFKFVATNQQVLKGVIE